jgi:hypothetical protein
MDTSRAKITCALISYTNTLKDCDPMEDWTELYIQNQQDQTRLLNALNDKKLDEALSINDRILQNTRSMQEYIIELNELARAAHTLRAHPTD